MIRLAARYADQWDTFPELAGTATDGVTTTVAERVAAFDAACLEAGRDPATIRRSTWTEADDDVSTEAGFEAFARTHRALGFTDFSFVPSDGRRTRRAAPDRARPDPGAPGGVRRRRAGGPLTGTGFRGAVRCRTITGASAPRPIPEGPKR